MRYFLPLSLLIILSACNAGRKAQTVETEAVEAVEAGPEQPGFNKNADDAAPSKIVEIESAFTLSPRATQLIQDIKKENGDLFTKNYSPSGEIIKKYSIRPMPEGYIVDGFLLVNESFDEDAAKSNGIYIRTRTGNRCVITLPVSSFESFLQTEGVEYFELHSEAQQN